MSAPNRPAIERLLDPRSIAVVGTSPSGGRAARAHQNLLRAGFRGALWAVNPRYERVFDTPCVPSLGAIGQPVDCVVVGLPAEATLRVMEEAAELGVGGAVLFASGFGEMGAAGEARQARLRELAAAAGIAVCGPNCLGLINVLSGAMATNASLPALPVPGPVALVAQSGALMTEVAGPLVERGIGLSWILSTGNEAVTALEDHLAYLVEQDSVTVLAAVVEAFRRPEGLLRVAARAAELRKPLVVLKLGRSARGQAAVSSHTGALAGDDRVLDAVFQRWGVTSVTSTDELIETLALFARHPWPIHGSVALISSSGGRCALLADLAQRAGLDLAELDAATHARLTPLLSEFSTIHNPLDPTGVVFDRADGYASILAAVAEDPGVGLLGVYQMARGTGSDPSGERARQLAGITAQVATAAGAIDKPLVVFTTAAGATLDRQVVATLEAAGLPLLQGADRALAAIAATMRYNAFLLWQRPTADSSPVDATDAAGVADAAGAAAAEVSDADLAPFKRLLDTRGALSEAQSLDLLAAHGIATPRRRLVTSLAQALDAAGALGYPAALKVSAPGLAHKTEQGLVRLGVAGEAELAVAFAELRGFAPEDQDGILVEEMLPPGVEVLVGVRSSPFGPAVLLGAGGTLAELVDDTCLRLAPLDRPEIAEMLASVRVSRLLQGFRGQPPVNVAALVTVLRRISLLACRLGHAVDTIDVNPVIVSEAGAVAADAKVSGPGRRT